MQRIMEEFANRHDGLQLNLNAQKVWAFFTEVLAATQRDTKDFLSTIRYAAGKSSWIP